MDFIIRVIAVLIDRRKGSVFNGLLAVDRGLMAARPLWVGYFE